MQIKVQTSLMKKSVDICKEALSKIIIQEERGHLLFKTVKKILTVSGTNNDNKALCIIPLEEELDEDIAFTADPKILEKLLPKVDLKEIIIEYNKENLVTKIYTSPGKESFVSLQSFPVESMLTFGDTLKLEKKIYSINREALLEVLSFLNTYLADIKEDKKEYDFIIFNKGVGFAGNGLNKMGFYAHESLKQFTNFRIRKSTVPTFISILSAIKDEDINLLETDRDIGVITKNNDVFYGCLKSAGEAPKINLDYLNPYGSYIEINKKELLKKMDRLIITSNKKKGTGIIMKLSGTGIDAYIDLTLVSNIKANERVFCNRVGNNTEDVEHTTEYNHMQNIISSFGKVETTRLYFEQDKFFKIYDVGKMNETKYVAAGVGAYSKVKS